MNSFYQVLADIVLMAHVAFVGFVVLGLILIVVGGFRHWVWTANNWFRVLHLLGIGIVVVQSWFGVICPLTTLEMWLRSKANANTYDGGFIQHWLQTLLYYDGSPWVFSVVYSLFAVLVVFTFVMFPPKFLSRVQVTRASNH